MFEFMKTEPDEEAIARQELGDIVRLSEEGVSLFAERARECRDVFWNGTASVESKLKVLGTNAIAMFQESGRAQKIIKSYNPDHVEL